MATLNNGRTKLTQNDLRRYMSEQKKKIQNEKIDSPLAKYRSDGQITCVVCNSIVKNEKLWKIHVNGKFHKDNVILVTERPSIPNVSTKRTLSDTTPVPPKKIKGILKNAPKPVVPEGFFDSANAGKTVKIESDTSNPLLRLQSYSNDGDDDSNKDNENKEVKEEDEKMDEDELEKKKDLPEGFFDDPIQDAKARHVEYKDPIQEEWERFQKEIKEENTVSNQIIEVDHEEAIAERQIDEIDEQLRNWSRVLDLEVKKEKVQAETAKGAEDMDEGASTDEEQDFDEFLDWRAKGSFR